MPEALKKADEVLQQSVQGITDLINVPALINLDFADVQTVMRDAGIAHIGIGEASGMRRLQMQFSRLLHLHFLKQKSMEQRMLLSTLLVMLACLKLMKLQAMYRNLQVMMQTLSSV